MTTPIVLRIGWFDSAIFPAWTKEPPGPTHCSSTGFFVNCWPEPAPHIKIAASFSSDTDEFSNGVAVLYSVIEAITVIDGPCPTCQCPRSEHYGQAHDWRPPVLPSDLAKLIKDKV